MVSGYLVTKAIAGGIMMMAALMIVLGHADDQAAVGVVPPIVAGIMLALTGGLLVGDLKQPKRFYYLLTKSNFDSWLVKGAYVLTSFAALSAVWFLLGAADAGDALKIVAIPTAILGAATALFALAAAWAFDFSRPVDRERTEGVAPPTRQLR